MASANTTAWNSIHAELLVSTTPTEPHPYSLIGRQSWLKVVLVPRYCFVQRRLWRSTIRFTSPIASGD